MTDNLSSHISSEYENEIIKTIPYYNYFHMEIINLVKSVTQKPLTWLDTGCGTGTLIEKALIEFPDFKFFLADPSENMLKKCMQRFNNPQVKIIGKYDTNSLSIDIIPDIITAVQSHHYMSAEERSKATDKCYNLLNDNGLYITFENIKFDNKMANLNGLKRWGDYQISMGRDKDVVKEHLNRFENNYFPITVSEHLDLLNKSGFRVVEQFWMSNMQAGFYGIK